MHIHIFGASGSGVTTLGQHLALNLGYTYFDSDSFFWQPSTIPFTVKRPRNERNQSIRQALTSTKDRILGGSVVNWGDDVFPPFDLVVFLWIPAEIRLQRLKERELQRYGEIINTDAERVRLYHEFMEWAADYDNHTGIANRTLKAHEEWLNKISAPKLELRGDMTVDERLTLVLDKIKAL